METTINRFDEVTIMRKKELKKLETDISKNNTQNLKISPNPADNSFHVTINTVLENNKIIIKDAVGKTILEQKMPNNKAGMEINTMNLSSGVYFLLLLNQNIVLEVKKLVINH
ncbi:MAG: T9SS type A sorting domain-containing protein [Bacteroidetes bacterium]|nr:T9SS type A sorting domain-containing protein [Bacteroidota bacterium]